MKIIHTSDIHLVKTNDERWEALEMIIDFTGKENANLLIIAGDLFDSESAMENLREDLRKLFKNTNFTTIIIPGNHDYRSYIKGLYFGDNVKVLSSKEEIFEKKNIIDEFTFENVRIIPFAYRDIGVENIFEFMLKLDSNTSDELTNILILHGELIDRFYSRDSFGEEIEGGRRYLPVKLSYFEDLHFDFVLAGHFHSKFDVFEFVNKSSKKSFFIYPGSPVSITRKEVGRRKVAKIEIKGKEVEINELVLGTFNYFSSSFSYSIENENQLSNLLEKIVETYKKFKNENNKSKILLNLELLINTQKPGITEKTVYNKINDFVEEKNDLIINEFKIRDISNIVNNELYIKVLKKIKENLEYNNEEKKRLEKLLINALSGAIYK